MSYTEDEKKQAEAMYIELFQNTPPDRILSKIRSSKIFISDKPTIQTLQLWRQDGDWVRKGMVEGLKISFQGYLNIPSEAIKHITPDNAVEMLGKHIEAFKTLAGTHETRTDNEHTDGGEGVDDDFTDVGFDNTKSGLPPGRVEDAE